MAVHHMDGELPELRVNSDSPIGVPRPTDLDTWGMSIVGHDLPVREVQKATNELGLPVRRHIDPVFWNSLERRVGRGGRVPIELRIDAAWPLYDGVASDRIGE